MHKLVEYIHKVSHIAASRCDMRYFLGSAGVCSKNFSAFELLVKLRMLHLTSRNTRKLYRNFQKVSHDRLIENNVHPPKTT